jgi:BON domain
MHGRIHGWSGPASILMLSLSLVLSGCVLVVGDEDDRGSSRSRDREWVADDDMRQSEYRGSSRRVPSADQLLRASLSETLRADPLLADQRVTVIVSRGDVTLHGEVRDLEAFERVIEVVTTTEGVDEVVSRLVVRVR